MSAARLDPIDLRRRRILRLALWAAGFLATTTACIGLLLHRLAHPKDMFQVTVPGIPADAAYWCLACDDGSDVRLLRTYGCQRFPPFQIFVSRAPDGTWRHRTRSFLPDVGIRWRTGRRYAVLWRDPGGHWHRCWIPAARVQTAPSQDPPMAGVKTLTLLPEDARDSPDDAELTRLGIRPVPGRSSPR